MKIQIIDKAFSFVWSELKNRFGTWFIISIKTFAIMFGLLLGAGLFFLLLSIIGLSPKAFELLGQIGDGYSVSRILFLIILLVSLYYLLYYLFSFGNVPALNALDATRKKNLRHFNNRVQTHALVGGILLYFLVVFLGALFFIIPGIIFAVRFSFVRWFLLDEQCGVFEAFSKSWALTKGYFWIAGLACLIDLILSGLAPLNLLNTFLSVRDLFLAKVYNQLKQK